MFKFPSTYNAPSRTSTKKSNNSTSSVNTMASRTFQNMSTPKKSHSQEEYDFPTNTLQGQTIVNKWDAQFEVQEIFTSEQTFVPSTDTMVRFKKMDHVRLNRARMMNWLIEVCYSYRQSWQTFWAAISILDMLIIEKGKVKVENIHLYGVTALFMASKYHEAYRILKIESIVEKVVYFKFSEAQILNCESEIFTWIFITRNDRSLHFPTMEDRIYEEFPHASTDQVKRIMKELFFCIQDPKFLFDHIGDKTEKKLVFEVGNAVMNHYRYANCSEIELHYRQNYECNSIFKYWAYLSL